MKNNLELLAPAGSVEKMKYAFAYGADAVYMGIPDFSLRVRVNRCTMDEVRDSIEYTHRIGKKIYVTVNIVAHNGHLEQLPLYLKQLNTWKPDALIISDPGVMVMAKKYAPDLEIHLSTQANATNWQTVKFWHEQGFKRVVLGREVTLAEIKEIHTKVPTCEIEYFVHGAMCMSYSGRCMLSAWLTGRSANLGDCSQPCRWRYKTDAEKFRVIEATVEEPTRPGVEIPVEEDRHGTYIFNSKDMCFIEYIPELIDAGVVSFKIEGRAKSEAYLARVVKAYRQASDLVAVEKDSKKQSFDLSSGEVKRQLKEIKRKVLDKLVHRGYTTGFLFGRDTVEQNHTDSHIGGEEKYVGQVLGCVKNGKKWKLEIRPHNAIRVRDKIRIMQPHHLDLNMTIKELYNEKGESIESGHGGAGYGVFFEVHKEVEEFGIVFKK